MSEPLVPRDEAAAVLAARKELGKEFEPELVDRFVEQIEKRLEERLAERRPDDFPRRGPDTAVTMVSLGVAIPLLGIAAGTAQLPGIIAVCVALVLVNLIVRRF